MDDLQPEFGLLKSDLQWRGKALREAIEEHDGPKSFKLDDDTEIQYHDTIAYMGEMDMTIAFFSIAIEIMNVLEKKLFELEFVVPEYRDGTIPRYVGKSRWDVFNRFEILDECLRRKVRDTRAFRNKLIHDLGDTQRTVLIHELENKIDVAIEVVEELESQVMSRTSVD